MDVRIKGIITNAFKGSKDNAPVYFDITDLENGGVINGSTRAASVEQLKNHGLVPMLITGEVTGRKYDRNQSLNFTRISIAPIPAAAADTSAPVAQPAGVNGTK